MANKTSGFTGFPDPTFGFFQSLSATQDREWYQAHKAEYQRDYVEPMTALLQHVRAHVASAYRGMTLKDPKLFRLHRDVRFSMDKSPFKTSLGGTLALKGGGAGMEPPAAFYLQIGTETFAGAGMYALTGDPLERFRTAVLDARKGPAIARITADLEAKGYTLEAMETLKSAPRGVDKEHPRIALLKRKGLVAGCPGMPMEKLPTPAFADWCVERALEMAPMVRWLAQHVA